MQGPVSTAALQSFFPNCLKRTWTFWLPLFEFSRSDLPFPSSSDFVELVCPSIAVLWKMIEVILNDRLGRKIRVKCNPDDTVGDLKKLVAAQCG